MAPACRFKRSQEVPEVRSFGICLTMSLLVSCAPERHTYEFQGKQLGCTFYEQKACGVDLRDCDDGARYYCLTDLKRLD